MSWRFGRPERCCRPCESRSAMRSCGRPISELLATGQRCTRRSTAAAGRPTARAGAEDCLHEGARHRRRRLHRIDAVRAAHRRRRRRRRPRLLHGLLSAARSRSEPQRAARAPRFRFVESTIRDADLPRCFAIARTSSISRPRPASGKAGDATSRSTRSTTSRRRSCCSRRRAARRHSSALSTRPAPPSTATTSPCRCARMRCRSQSRRTA